MFHVKLFPEIQELLVAKFLHDVIGNYGPKKGAQLIELVKNKKFFVKWFPNVDLESLLDNKRYEQIVLGYQHGFGELTFEYTALGQILKLRENGDEITIMIELGKIDKNLWLVLAIPKHYPIGILFEVHKKEKSSIKAFSSVWINTKGKVEILD
ncbi:MAG: hypothetical protein NZM37_09490 [Sandaracinaceae bacterium]|nr:hypothetical protein [Sandaracinaceae bacterium]